MAATFILSLDCEGKWGSADCLTPVHRETLADERLSRAYGDILRLLDEHQVAATFAFAGLFSQSAEQFSRLLPQVEAFAAGSPDYLRPALTDIEASKGSGWHGAHLVDAVAAATADHEIALHGVTHVPWDRLTSGLVQAELALLDELDGPAGLDPRELSDLRPVERMMTQDMLGYLANDILVKVDRAAMAVSLETRVPLLDPEVVEFAWRLPLDLKIRGRTTKWLLREVLYRHVPRTLIDRPKMGFGIPLDSWLRGPLRDWAEDLLDEWRLREQGFFRPEPVRKAWAAQQRGESTAFKLWPTLIFQSWLDSQTERAPLSSTRAEPKPA